VVKLFDILSEGTKPHARVTAGMANQDKVWEDIQTKFGKRAKFVEMAKASQTSADLICTIDGQRVQIEVKGRQSASKWSIATDVRMGADPSKHDLSGKVPSKLAILNKSIKIISGGEYTSLRDYVKHHQNEHKKHVNGTSTNGGKQPAKPGFAGQEGVTKAGYFEFHAPAATLKLFSPILRSLWKESGDDYVATVIDEKITYYKISGVNLIPGAKSTLPLTAVMVAVSGGALHNKTHDVMHTRVGLKFKL
jgi:hypothetical protein